MSWDKDTFLGRKGRDDNDEIIYKIIDAFIHHPLNGAHSVHM